MKLARLTAADAVNSLNTFGNYGVQVRKKWGEKNIPTATIKYSHITKNDSNYLVETSDSSRFGYLWYKRVSLFECGKS